MPSLTRAEAAARAAVVDVESYTIDLDLTGGGDTFRSRTVVTFRSVAGAATFAEFEPAALRSATLNGAAVALDDARLALTGLAERNELVVEASMAYSNTGEGLHRFVDPADDRTYLWAHMFLDGARRIFPCFDQPDLKAVYTVSVTAPADWLVAANAPVRSADGGRWVFETTTPLSTYFVTLIAGPYHAVRDVHDGIPLALYARAALTDHLDTDAPELFEVTKQCLDAYHAMFAVRYPFGHYQQAFVPEFNFGAMENPGLVVFRDEFVYRSAVTDSQRETRANVVAHEMAHMWFGDLVTMAWWDDLWLNESFAEYMGTRVTAAATRFTRTWTTFAMGDKAWGMRADQRPSTHPVAPAEVADTALALLNFDGISYAKGAAVLKQLVAWVGDAAFRAGLNEHFAAHAYGNATLADLLTALSEASGRDLSGWADVWLRQAQINTLRVSRDVADGRYAAVSIEQTAPAAFPTLRPHRLGLGLYDRAADGSVTLRRSVLIDVAAAAETPVPSLAGEPVADLLLLNDGDLTYAKIRLDPASVAAVPSLLPRLDDPLARAVIWAATLDAVVDGERPVSELVTQVLAALPVETEVVIIEDVLKQTRGLIDRYCSPPTRPAALDLVAQACDRLLASSPAGSSRQLAAARGLIGATVDASRLRSWLVASSAPAASSPAAVSPAAVSPAAVSPAAVLPAAVSPAASSPASVSPVRPSSAGAAPDGLAIDTDLRWLIVYRLVVLGAADASDIDAEYERDHTATGEQWAARCRAAIPSSEAKAAAWATLTTDTAVSNRIAEAAAMGFWQPEQLALTEPYVERYFAEMPEMMTVRSGFSAERVALTAYPALAVEPRTRELAATLLARDDLSPILRRVVTDSDDDMRRALESRFGP